MSPEKLMAVLEQLEQAIDGRPRLPLTDLILVNAADLLDLVDRLRTLALEMGGREGVAGGGEEERPSWQEGRALVEAAQAEARRIMEEARQRAEELRSGAASYADRTLGQLAESLEKALQVVQRGRAELKKELT
ncbi:MAG: hypothetical protein QJR13_02930 [Bacillota bacterium]|nr:hypothetical protein [Bacillota bacterium]